MTLFSAEKVIEKMKSFGSLVNVKTVEETGSTNSDLKLLAGEGAPEGTVLIAGEQTDGRGRLGRSFYSPKDTGLYMSVLLRPALSARESVFITVCAACAVSGAIDALCSVRTGIKWVNDIFLDGKKVCGILAESAMKGSGIDYTVLGIGVNVSTVSFPASAGAAGSLGASRDIRADLAAAVLERFFGFYGNIAQRTFMELYREKSVLRGREMTLVRGSESFSGTAAGIDDEARLLLRLADGRIMAFESGEATIGSANF